MKTARILLWAWLALVFAYFVVINTFAYGIANWLLEWQHANFGGFLPTVTLLGLTLIPGIPALAIFAIYWRRQSRRQAAAGAPNAVNFATRQFRLLLIVAGLSASGAVISLLLLLTLPPVRGPVEPLQTIVPTGSMPTGPARLDGVAPTGPQIRYTTRLLWSARVVRYVPVGTPGQGTRLFVQIDDSGLVPSSVTGVSVKNALPPSVRNLFVARGITASGAHYVLFSDPAIVRRPYLLAALQFAIAGLLVLIAALIQRRNLRRARRDTEALALAPATG